MSSRTVLRRVSAIDSHTAGEPTRLVVSGGPDLGEGPLADRRDRFRRFHDDFRTAVVNEPRGSDVIVGALLCEPFNKRSTAGVIFFNNVGYLGMCGHGMIGLIASLAHLGRIEPGIHLIETPVGVVSTILHPSGKVTVENVPSFRFASSVVVEIPGHGTVHGDIAWGGNWFYLVEDHGKNLALANVDELTEFTWAIRQALTAGRITGSDDQEIDHIELFGPPSISGTDSTNFVLCPGKAYDRSPCGTGTSAKMACLYAEGKLAPGQLWRQAGILGTVFEGSIRVENEKIIPSITGTACLTAESTLLLDPDDPFCMGIPK
ncbi:MAG TPA: proline racemase family protein [Silvibacterium sp.]|nr:proline racemase family protein [Silvibacterium sp.]